MLIWFSLGLLLLSPYVLALWSHHRVLHEAKTSDTAWFRFLQRIQWVGIAHLGGWISGYSQWAAPAVTQWLASHRLTPWTTPLSIVAMVIPLTAFQIFAAVLVQGVNRSIRGAEVSGQEVLSDSLRSLVGVGVLLVGLCGTIVALSHGHWRLAIASSLAGMVGAVTLGAPRHRLRSAPLAITHGELRDRLFALAARAKVPVKQLYVVPLTRTRIANAVAVQGESVMITDYLLAHLSRDEMDAVLAHELAHLRHRHPLLLTLTLFLGGMGVWVVYNFAHSGIAGPVAIAVVILGFMAVSRRIEFVADAAALDYGIRPEALVTGLARVIRLNHMPQDWGRLHAWTLTHPSNRRRAERIARRAGIALERIPSLLDDTPPAPDRYDVPAQVREDRLFTTTFKTRVLQHNAWAMLFMNATACAAFALLIRGTSIERYGVIGFVSVVVLAFAATFALMQYLSVRPYRGLRARLANRLQGLDPEGPLTSWVGLSPEAEPRLYEGMATWDVGFLTLDSGRLVYRGEEASFSLGQGEIGSVEIGPRFPGWVPVYGVVVQWRRNGVDGRFTLFPVHASGLITYAAAARRMRERVERWRSEIRPERNSGREIATDEACESQPVPSRGSAAIPIALPPTGPVTGMAPHEVVKPAAVTVTIVLQITIAFGVAALMGLRFAPRHGLGVGHAVLASVLAYILLIVPLLTARRPPRTAAKPEVRRAA